MRRSEVEEVDERGRTEKDRGRERCREMEEEREGMKR